MYLPNSPCRFQHLPRCEALRRGQYVVPGGAHGRPQLAPVALVLWGIFQGEVAVAAAADILAIAAMVVLAVRSTVPEVVEPTLRRMALPVWVLLVAA